MEAYALPELDLPELTGISAEDLTEVYNKNAHRITVSGIQEGDEVQDLNIRNCLIIAAVRRRIDCQKNFAAFLI